MKFYEADGFSVLLNGIFKLHVERKINTTLPDIFLLNKRKTVYNLSRHKFIAGTSSFKSGKCI